MNALLKLSGLIDALNERIGKAVYWCILIAVLISATNAVVRKAFNMSSNAFLEIQWWLFSAVFLLCAAYTLLHNEHVRIDVVTARFSKRTQTWLDVFGFLVFLLPMTLMMVWLSGPWAFRSYVSQEMSSNAGGLIYWPVTLQGISELIKRLAFLQGLIPDPTEKHKFPAAEEQLIEELRARMAEEAKKNG
jgi:TRAP-type mannitol/chloroaromatic compound transport system permease small subunit